VAEEAVAAGLFGLEQQDVAAAVGAVADYFDFELSVTTLVVVPAAVIMTAHLEPPLMPRLDQARSLIHQRQAPAARSWRST
jgi:hypothetical protein